LIFLRRTEWYNSSRCKGQSVDLRMEEVGANVKQGIQNEKKKKSKTIGEGGGRSWEDHASGGY